MRYRLNGEQMYDVAVLPSAISRYVRLASDTQLRVLLWIATAGKEGADAASCAAALGGRVTEAACADALRYWEAEGLLRADGETAAASGQATRPVVAPAAKPAAETTVAKPMTAPRPASVKPQMPEVIRRQKGSAEFAYLLTAASARLGKALSPGDQETLLYLYDTAGLPAEVILMVIAYAVSRDKGNMRYVEKTALDWADRDIRTIAAADEFLCRLSRCEQAWQTLAEWCTLPPRPTAAQKELAAKWIAEWELSREMVCLAADRCRENIGKFQYTYVDRVLEGWRAEGLDTPQKVKAAFAPKHGKTVEKPPREGGFDVGKYEELVRTHTPKYRKKGTT